MFLSRFMKSSWLIALLVNFALAVYFVVSGLGFGMWCAQVLISMTCLTGTYASLSRTNWMVSSM